MWRRGTLAERRSSGVARRREAKAWRRSLRGRRDVVVAHTQRVSVAAWIGKAIESMGARLDRERMAAFLAPKCGVCTGRLRRVSRAGVLRCQTCGRDYVRGAAELGPARRVVAEAE